MRAFVYNLSVKVAWPIAKDWLDWQKQEHIPEIMRTGQFESYQIYQLQDTEDNEGPTFIIQFFCESEEFYIEYISKYASALRQKALSKWGDQYIAYRTTMKAVH